ncbi:MAG: sigma factor-like helix-turn-helix DNA-binding protein [Terriglobales bacterium]
MNVHISYKAAKAPAVETEFRNHVEKLGRRLHVFRPELVHLHAIVARNSAPAKITVSLNLRLPSGQLAAAEKAPTAVAAVKACFKDLLAQLTKHKELLRSQHKWRRRKPGAKQGRVPFEQTLAAVKPPSVTGTDVRAYVNANLQRLERFVERELRYRQASGQIHSGQVTREEVIDEVIATALEERQERPQPLSLERWLYRLSLQAMSDLAECNEEHLPAVRLEQSARKPNVRASSDSQLQYHQPDEMLHEEDVIADRRVWTPEDIASSDEILALVEATLVRTAPQDREAFVLFAVEGFSVEEIAAATDRRPERVRASISAAREHLKKELPVSQALRERLLRHSKIA